MKEQSSSSQKIALDVPSSWEYTVKREEGKFRRDRVRFFSTLTCPQAENILLIKEERKFRRDRVRFFSTLTCPQAENTLLKKEDRKFRRDRVRIFSTLTCPQAENTLLKKGNEEGIGYDFFLIWRIIGTLIQIRNFPRKNVSLCSRFLPKFLIKSYPKIFWRVNALPVSKARFTAKLEKGITVSQQLGVKF